MKLSLSPSPISSFGSIVPDPGAKPAPNYCRSGLVELPLVPEPDRTVHGAQLRTGGEV